MTALKENYTAETVGRIIPIEKINGPVLFLSSKHDAVWESYKSGVIMEKRLSEVSFPYAHKHIAFPYLSHVMITNSSQLYKLLFKIEKQYPKQCAAEHEQLKLEQLVEKLIP